MERLRHGFRIVRMSDMAVASRPIRYSEVCLSIFDYGGSELVFGGRIERIRARQMHVHWGAVPHQPLRHEIPSLFWALLVPLPWFLEWHLPPDFAHRVLAGDFLREPDLALGDLDSAGFLRWERDLKGGVPSLARACELEVQARLLRLAHSVSRAPNDSAASCGGAEPDAGASSGGRIGAILTYVAENHARPIRMEEIGAAVHMHPNAAMRLFRRAWGDSLGHFITEYRLWQAQSLLACGNATVAAIAEQCGFGSLTQFHEHFRRSTGTTPAAFRRALDQR